MGHEIGHIVARHGLENVKRAQKYNTWATVGVIAGAVLGGRSGAQMAAMAGNLVAGGYLMKHSREAEREADFLGLYNIKALSYNTGGMIEMFNSLAALNPNQMGSIMSSHPPAPERAENTRVEIDQHLQGSDRTGRTTSTAFQRIKTMFPSKGQQGQQPQRVRPRN